MRMLKFKKIKTANLSEFPEIIFNHKIKGSWELFKKKAYHYLLKKSFYNFLNWPIIKQTMFVDNANYLNYEYNFLCNSERKYLSLMSEDLWGKPTPSDLDLATSGNRIHHTYLLARYELETKKNLNNFKVIFEFGGGYGSFARLIHKLNFSGIYIIFDFDIFNIIQFNYLEKFGYQIFVQPEKVNGNGIYLFNDISTLNKFISNLEINLFIATWSLSESNIETRDKINNIFLNSEHYLIAFQSEFDSINNIEYFTNKLFNKNGIVNKLDHMGNGQNYIFI